MRRYIVRRLLQSVVILFVLSVVVFLLLRVAPGAKPWELKCGLGCTKERLAALKEEMGGNNPYFPISFQKSAAFIQFNGTSQYWSWVKELSSGSLGRDWNNAPVGPELQRRLPVTLELLTITTLVTIAVGVPFGIISAVMRNSPADYGARLSAILGLAVPNFWLAILMVYFLVLLFGWLPPLGYVNLWQDPGKNLQQLIFPAIALGFFNMAFIARVTRSSMLEVLREDYIRTARSKGLTEPKIINRHALKNALLPVVTVSGYEFGRLIAGTVVIESIFLVPGVGRMLIDAVFHRDYPLIQAVIVVITVLVLAMNLALDVLYGWLNPRIRYT